MMDHFVRDQNEVINTLRQPTHANPHHQQQPHSSSSSSPDRNQPPHPSEQHIHARNTLKEMSPGNYESMQKLFSAKSFDIPLPAADEIRVPLELYTVVQDKMFLYRQELDDLRREMVHLRRQKRADTEKISHITRERNASDAALLQAQKRIEQLSSINTDLIKERNHHQTASTDLDDQMRFALSEAEDRSARLAKVLEENDELRGNKTWLEQKLQGVQEEGATHEKAATSAQTRLKVALMATTKLAAEKKNLFVVLEELKRAVELAAARETALILRQQQQQQQQRETADGHRAELQEQQILNSAAVAAPKLNWLSNSYLAAGRDNSGGANLRAKSGNRSSSSNDNNEEDNHDADSNHNNDNDEDDDNDALATDAEARAAAEDAMLMMVKKVKRCRGFYQARMEIVEQKLMEEHDKHSLDVARGAYRHLDRDFTSAHLNGDEANDFNNCYEDDDDDEIDHEASRKAARRQAGKAVRALSLFKYQMSAQKAKEAAAAAAIVAGSDGEVCIDDEEEYEEEVEEDEEEEQQQGITNSSSSPSAIKSKSKKKKKIVRVRRKQNSNSAESASLINPVLPAGFEDLDPAAIRRQRRQQQQQQQQQRNDYDDDDCDLDVRSDFDEDEDGENNGEGQDVFTPSRRGGQSSNAAAAASADDASASASTPRRRRGHGGGSSNSRSARDVDLVKSALFKKFFNDKTEDEEKAAVAAATESILAGVRTAEAMMEYMDMSASESLSLQDLRDKWEAVKHMARARLSETAAESRALSLNFTALLKRRDYFKKSKNSSSTNAASPESGGNQQQQHQQQSSSSPLVQSQFRPLAFNASRPRFFAESSVKSPLPAANQVGKGAMSARGGGGGRDQGTSTSSPSSSRMKNDSSAPESSGGKNSKRPATKPATAAAGAKKVQTRTVGVSCRIEPRPETAHWCRNTLIQPDDLNEVDGCLFGLMPRIYFELHNVIHDVIREARQRARITLPIADPASFIGDGERRTIADVHCAMKFDLFALMALRDLLRVVGKTAKGTSSTQELRERLIWYRECIESQRMVQLDERYRIDPRLLSKLNIVDRRALFKFRTETHKLFRMPGTLGTAAVDEADPEVVTVEQPLPMRSITQAPQIVQQTLSLLHQQQQQQHGSRNNSLGNASPGMFPFDHQQQQQYEQQHRSSLPRQPSFIENQLKQQQQLQKHRQSLTVDQFHSGAMTGSNVNKFLGNVMMMKHQQLLLQQQQQQHQTYVPLQPPPQSRDPLPPLEHRVGASHSAQRQQQPHPPQQPGSPNVIANQQQQYRTPEPGNNNNVLVINGGAHTARVSPQLPSHQHQQHGGLQARPHQPIQSPRPQQPQQGLAQLPDGLVGVPLRGSRK